MAFKEIEVEHSWPDAEDMAVSCVCGHGDPDSWDFVISGNRPDLHTKCPKCGRKYYWKMKLNIFMEEPDETDN